MTEHNETSTPEPVSDPRDAAVAHGQFERKLKIRVVLSVMLFVGFLVASVVCALMHVTSRFAPGLLALLIGAIAIMPRQTLPSDFELNATSKPFAMRMLRMKNWLAIARFIFFTLAIGTFFLLPRLIS